MPDDILLVDDERTIRVTLSRALEDMNLNVETAASGAEALSRLSERPYRLVLLDLKLPDIDGMEVLRRALDLHPGLRVVIFTAHGSVGSAVEAIKHGAADFIEKPFLPAALRSAVGRVLHGEGSMHGEMQETRGPEGEDVFRIVMPVPDARTAARLMPVATAPVHAYTRVELIPVQVIEVPWQTPPGMLREMERETIAQAHQKLLQASKTATDTGLRVRPIVLHAHSTAAVIGNLVEREQADQVLLVLEEATADLRSLSRTQVGEILRRVSCGVLLVRPCQKPVQKVLALVSESPHAVQAVKQAHLMIQGLGVATLTLMNVREEGVRARETGLRLIRRTAEAAGVGGHRYEACVVQAADVATAMERVIPSFDAVFAGATQSSRTAERLFGSVPRMLAGRVGGTHVIVRGPQAKTRSVGETLAVHLFRREL